MTTDCSDLLDELLLVRSRQELDALLDASRECFTRAFLQRSALAIDGWLRAGESDAWQIWTVLEYAVRRLGQSVLRGDLSALWAEAERKQGNNDFVLHYEQAAEHYRAAGTEAAEELTVCLRNLALAYMQRGDLDRAEGYYRAAADAAATSHLPREHAKALSELGKLMQRRGALSIANQCFQGALLIFEQQGDEAGAVAQLNHLGVVQLTGSQWREAESTFRQALERARRTPTDRSLAMSLGNLASVLHEQGRALEAQATQEDARAHIERIGEPEWLANWWDNFGLFSVQSGHLAQAVSAFERAAAIQKSVQNTIGEASSTGHLADAYLRGGETQKAHALYTESLSKANASGAVLIAAQQHIGLGTIAQSRGDLTVAKNHYEAARLTYSNAGIQSDEGAVLRLLAGLAMDSGDTEKALQIYRSVLQQFEELEAPFQVAHVMNDYAGALQEIGRAGDALAYYQEALSRYRRVNDLEQVAVVLSNMAGAYHFQGKTEQALGALDEARELASRLGLRRVEAGILSNLGTIQRLRGETNAAIQAHREAIGLSKQTGDCSVELEASNSLSGLLYDMGENDEARRLNAEVLNRTAAIGLPRLHTLALINRGFMSSESGHFREGEADLLSGLQVAEAHKLHPLQVIAHRNLGTFYQTLGSLAEAQAHYEAALHLAREVGVGQDEAEALGNLGNMAYDCGDLPRALNLHRAAFDLYISLGDRRGQAIEMINLANVALESRDDAVALRLNGQALRLCLDIGYRLGQALAVLGQGHVHFRAGANALAEECYQEASRLLAGLGHPEPLRVVVTNLGLLVELRGDLQAAQDYYRRAIELIEAGRHGLSGENPRISYFGRRLAPYERLILIHNRERQTGAGFALLERSRARAFVELLARALVATAEMSLDYEQVQDLLAA